VCVAHHTRQLTPWRGVLVEKLIVAQLVENFPSICGTERSITCSHMTERYVKNEGKVVSMLFLTEHHAMKAYWGSEGIAPPFFDLGTRWR
jgi:hypothetical protein